MRKLKDISQMANSPIVVIDLERSTYAASNKVFGTGGVCPTLCARDYKDPYKIAIYDD